jgi:hypothetical protein
MTPALKVCPALIDNGQSCYKRALRLPFEFAPKSRKTRTETTDRARQLSILHDPCPMDGLVQDCWATAVPAAPFEA